MSEDTYANDLALIRRQAEPVELLGPDDQRVLVVPAWQGRVMTSTPAGKAGPSFGWLNRPFIAAGHEDSVFNNFGGEDRFWLGPEAGQFGLWFRQDEPFDMDHWRTPEGFNSGPFEPTEQDQASVAMARRLAVSNYSGTTFDCGVERTVRLLGPGQAAELLGTEVPDGARMVAFESENVLANVGDAPWASDGGLLSLWILGQFKPLPRGKVIVPFRPGSEADLGPRATTNYFGEIPGDRCRFAEQHVLFACDGKHRGKIGISPRRSRGVIGSYDPDGGALTLVKFNQPLTASELPYVNSLWEVQARPFAGDAINSYNDGEPTPGAGQLGPFYEIETSSPAAVLKPGESLTHVHRTFHFTGDPEGLDLLARKTLGITLDAVT